MNQQPVQVIEQTAKKWKALRLMSVLMFFVGCCTAASGSGAEKASPGSGASLAAIGAFIILGSIALYIYARVAAWWHHG